MFFLAYSVMLLFLFFFFFFNDTATTEIYTLSLHDALPILGGEQDFAREIDAGNEVADQAAAGHHRRFLLIRRPSRQQDGRRMAAGRDLVGQRHGQESRCEPEPRVKADVLRGPRHRLETEGRDAAVDEPVRRRAHDRLPDTGALPVRAHGERTHPPFDPRLVRHVERRDVAVLVAPHHRALAGIEQRVAPDQRIQLRDADADEAVAAIAIGESLGKDAVQPLDVALDGWLRAGDSGFRQPRSHRVVPGWRYRRARRSHQWWRRRKRE